MARKRTVDPVEEKVAEGPAAPVLSLATWALTSHASPLLAAAMQSYANEAHTTTDWDQIAAAVAARPVVR